MKVVDEDIKKTKSKPPFKGYRHTHPSFGRIRVANCQGNMHLFGSEVQTRSFISLTVSECEVAQDLGQNWYHAKNVITEVYMTPVQYAELIT